MFNFQRGDFVPVTVQTAGLPAVLLNIKGHTLDLTCLLFDVTSTGSGGVTARISGKLDAAGTVNADFDADAPPYVNPPAIMPGLRGICVFGVSPVRGIQVPTICEKLHFESSVESEVKYSFDVKMNSLAGLFVFPAL